MHVCVKLCEHWLYNLDCTASAGLHVIFADFAVRLTFGVFWWFYFNLGSLDFKTCYQSCLVTFDGVFCMLM